MADEGEFGITRSGALPEDWHERNDPGYIEGGADRLADKLLAEGPTGTDAPAGDGWSMKRDADHGQPRHRRPSPADGVNDLDRP